MRWEVLGRYHGRQMFFAGCFQSHQFLCLRPVGGQRPVETSPYWGQISEEADTQSTEGHPEIEIELFSSENKQ